MSQDGWQILKPQVPAWRKARSTFMLLIFPLAQQLIGWRPTFWQMATWMYDVRRSVEYHNGDAVFAFHDGTPRPTRWKA